MSMFILGILVLPALTSTFVRASLLAEFPEIEYWKPDEYGPDPGAMSTGLAPFLAQTDAVPGPTGTTSFVPNEPLQTSQAIPDNSEDINIFEYMGNLSPYFVNSAGFGADEYSLPSVCEITQVNILSRHGSRYPQLDLNMLEVVAQWQEISQWKGSLAYSPLNDVELTIDS